VHYGSEEDYDALRDRERKKLPAPDSPSTERYIDLLYPYWFYNDIAGFVELRLDGDTLHFAVFAARSQTPPHKWRRDRRMTRSYVWYDSQHVSLRFCKTPTDYVETVHRCLGIATTIVPKKMHFDWSFWDPVIRHIDWAGLVREPDD